MKVGDLVVMRDLWSDVNGQVGIITKVPRTRHGRWAILLTSGELIATGNMLRMEVINESR